MHTNATVSPANGASTVTLTRDDKTLTAQILSPSGATFSTSQAIRFDTDPTPPEPDQPNPNITVLIVDLGDAGAGNNGNVTLQVLFTPQWDGNPSFSNPPNVALASWTLTSHNS
jgi:hypothetical protein